MSAQPFRIFPLGDQALTIEFGTEISEALNNKAIGLSNYFEAFPFPGFIETVPAFASTTIFYDVSTVRKNVGDFRSAFETVKHFVENAALNSFATLDGEFRTIEIPISFADKDAPDLDFAAETSELSRREIIEIFTSRAYRVYMLGFLPGFAYMGKVDKRIAVPRKSSPRLKVPKGSVGIGGRQTGIYPLESPGGWQIIGRTTVELFAPQENPPCILRPGDSVKFVSDNP